MLQTFVCLKKESLIDNSFLDRNMLTMDMENYLVPDSQNLPQTSASANQYPTVTYTPVITGQVMPQFTGVFQNVIP